MGKWLDAARAIKAQHEAALAEKDSTLAALRESITVLKNRLYWAEIDLGSTVTVGTICRYVLKDYECIAEHKKSVLNSPINKNYWQEVTE